MSPLTLSKFVEEGAAAAGEEPVKSGRKCNCSEGALSGQTVGEKKFWIRFIASLKVADLM